MNDASRKVSATGVAAGAGCEDGPGIVRPAGARADVIGLWSEEFEPHAVIVQPRGLTIRCRGPLLGE